MFKYNVCCTCFCLLFVCFCELFGQVLCWGLPSLDMQFVEVETAVWPHTAHLATNTAWGALFLIQPWEPHSLLCTKVLPLFIYLLYSKCFSYFIGVLPFTTVVQIYCPPDSLLYFSLFIVFSHQNCFFVESNIPFFSIVLSFVSCLESFPTPIIFKNYFMFYCSIFFPGFSPPFKSFNLVWIYFGERHRYKSNLIFPQFANQLSQHCLLNNSSFHHLHKMFSAGVAILNGILREGSDNVRFEWRSRRSDWVGKGTGKKSFLLCLPVNSVWRKRARMHMRCLWIGLGSESGDLSFI